MKLTRIYLVSNCFEDPNKIYIGKEKSHQQGSREDDHRKTFGIQAKFEYIDKCKGWNYKKWKPLECFWIKHFKDCGFEVLNKNEGGGGPSFHTQETKDKISRNRRDKGHKCMIQYDLNGDFIREWDKLNDISNFLKVKYASLSKSCNTPNFQVRGFLWRYKTNNYPLHINPYIKPTKSQEARKSTSEKLKGIPKPEGFGEMMRKARINVPKPKGFGDKISKSLTGKPSKKAKIVLQFDMDGNFIKEYPHSSIAAIETNSNSTTISKVCRGIFSQTNGFKWKYK